MLFNITPDDKKRWGTQQQKFADLFNLAIVFFHICVGTFIPN